MIENADRWAPAYAEAGATIVTAHIEATAAPFRLADELHRLGAGVGIALRPTTPLSAVEHLLGRIDLLLLMTVEPGFGGQSFIEAMLPKIERARRLVSEEGLELRIQIDDQMFHVVCAECGKDTEVPFEPKTDRPVYCRDCFNSKAAHF